MSEVQVTMPIIDAFMLVLQYSKFLKDAVAAKKKEMEGMMILTHECSAIIQRLDVPRKLVDPGCFTLPCALGPMVFERCLCNLGASVSLMPLSIAKKLGFTQYKKCKLSLVLADRSVKIPVGILEDLPLMVGNFEIPTDFVLLEMGEEAQDPLILGRPFLTTAGAIVNVRQGKIDIHLGQGNILHFDINEVMKKPTIQNQVFYIDEMDALADDLLEELALEDSLQNALTIEREVQVIENKESDAYVKMLDSHKGISGEGQNEELTYEAHHASSATQQENLQEDDWSELKAPKVELKPLPHGVRYAFLGPNETYPVIVSSELSEDEFSKLLNELKKYRKAIGYSLDDIKGISPSLCMHRIHLEDESLSSVSTPGGTSRQQVLAAKKREGKQVATVESVDAGGRRSAHSKRSKEPKGKGVALSQEEENEDITEEDQAPHKRAKVSKGKKVDTERDRTNTPTEDELYGYLKNGVLWPPTRFAVIKIMEELEIGDDIKQMLVNKNMQSFFTMAYPTYEDESCQFLSSLVATFHATKHVRQGWVKIKFKVHGKVYNMTFKKIGQALGLQDLEESSIHILYDAPREESIARMVWKVLAGKTRKPSRDKNASISHPSVRYLHRLIVHTIFPRKEPGTVNDEELQLLHQTVQHFAHPSQLPFVDTDFYKNFGMVGFFVKRLVHYKE
ncbi:hypothetical protein YC2023_083345 [Brassica napus]